MNRDHLRLCRRPPAVGELPARESLAAPCPASFAPPVSVSSAAVVCSFPCPSCHPCLPCLLLFSHHDSSRRVNVNLTGRSRWPAPTYVMVPLCRSCADLSLSW